MLGWLKKKATEKQIRNLRDNLSKLIPAANLAHASILTQGDATPEQKRRIKELQDDLMFCLAGPLSLDEVRTQIVDPALAQASVSEGAVMAVEHVMKTAKES